MSARPAAEELQGAPRATPSPPSSRFAALDGLRGLAALVVVLHHMLLVAQSFLRPDGDPPVLSLWWWIESTPLKLLTAGKEAVLVFFVLSGLVVALPVLKRADFSWPGFAAGRFIRLYLPAWGALALATTLVVALPRDGAQVTGDSWVDVNSQQRFGTQALLRELSLMVSDYQYDNALWTLRWEITFSVLLPVLIGIAVVLRRRWLPLGALAVGAITWGTVIDLPPLAYLPMFFLGTLIAVHLPGLRRRMERMSAAPRARRRWAALLGGSALLLVAQWLLMPVVPADSAANHALQGVEPLGAVGLVIGAIGCASWRALLETRFIRFLGRTSFSLYLVHVPVLTSFVFLVGDWNWWLLLPVGLPLCILAGWGFFVGVERPLHRLARAAGGEVTRAMARFHDSRAV